MMDEDEAPSDTTTDETDGFVDVESSEEAELPSDVEDLESLRASAIAKDAESSLLALCAATSRGECATEWERADVDAMCRDLEASNPARPLEGRWRLAYSSEPGLYRSSPFFWAFSQLLSERATPLRPRNSPSDKYDAAIYALTDALPFYQVGAAFHTVRPGQLVSEVEVEINLFDALLPRAKSVMTTTATTVPSARGLTLTIEKTEVKDSSLEAVPGFGFISDLAFPTKNAFASLANAPFNLAPGAATVEMLATYTSETLRVTRTESGLLFVHVKDPAEF